MIITILIFIVILGILVFVHEFGHFIVAKKSGMQVEEFGFGFPPRIAGIQKVDGKWRWVWGHKTPTTPSRSAGHPSLAGGEAPAVAKAMAGKPQLTKDVLRSSPPLQGGVPERSEGEGVGDSTIYSINAIPLGGFVRILGENNEGEENPGSFINKGFWPRLFTLIAGVTMNIILAWVIFTIGYTIGLPAAVNSPSDVPAHASFSKPQIAILDVSAGLPADKAGIKPNDIILGIDGKTYSSVPDIQKYVTDHEGKQVVFNLQRENKNIEVQVIPQVNPPEGQGPTGIELALVGKVKYPILFATIEGAKTTLNGLVSIVSGLYQLFAGHLGFASLGGPVKIAKLTGQVADMGFVYLMQFTALLSLNLAVLNILPFPALDGGRVLFLLIEKIRRKRNNQKVEQIFNTAGFVFLILLMIAVTVQDIIRK